MKAALAALATSSLLGAAACSGSTSPADPTAPSHSPGSTGPAQVAELADGAVGVADVAGTAWLVQPAAGTVRTGDGHEVEVGDAPLRIVATPAGVWVSVIRDGAVVRIDPTTGVVDRRVRLRPGGSEPEGLAWDGHALWVVDQAHDRVVRLDSDGAPTAAYATAAEPRLVATGPGGTWVTSFGGSALTRVRNGRARTVPLPGCVGPQGVAEAVGRVWVACTLSGRAVAVDAGTMRVVARVDDLPDADAVVASGAEVYVVGQSGPTVHVVDASSGALVDTIALDAAHATSENVGAAVVGGDLVVTHPDVKRVYRLPLP